ncbi:MAG: hypothetical protein KBS35_01970 [Mycoplasma sp.]|nr:hypothetical protein [Candidatus Hennigella equi]
MKSQSIFFVHSTHKTKSWWMFLSVLVLVFVPFLIVWLLCGEFNLLNNDWLIAKNASVWHGYVTQDNINHLFERYGKYVQDQNVLLSELQEYLANGKQGSINAYTTFFNPILLAPLFGLLAWSVGYPILFNATKVSGLDVLPFSIGIGIFMLVTIISGLIPQWGQNLLAVYWLVRIVIAALLTFFTFIIANYFTNKYIANRPYATDIFFGYKTIEKENALAKEQLKENLDTFKKHNDQDESYVEIKEGD